MAKSSNWFKDILSGGLRGIAHLTVVQLGVPLLGISAVTAVLGWLGGLPWFYIWVGLVLALAGGFHFLLKFSEWRYRNRVEGKLSKSKLEFYRDIRNLGICAHLVVKNHADFPLELQLMEFNVRIGGHTHEEELPRLRRHLRPRGSLWINSVPINVKPEKGDHVISGFLNYKMRYGRPGRLAHTLSGRKQIAIRFNDDGRFVDGKWIDAEEAED